MWKRSSGKGAKEVWRSCRGKSIYRRRDSVVSRILRMGRQVRSQHKTPGANTTFNWLVVRTLATIGALRHGVINLSKFARHGDLGDWQDSD